MNQCPSCTQVLNCSRGSANRLHGCSGQRPRPQALINAAESVLPQPLTSPVKESQQQGEKARQEEVNTAGCCRVVRLDRFLLFGLGQPFEQCTPDEFHKEGGGGGADGRVPHKRWGRRFSSSALLRARQGTFTHHSSQTLAPVPQAAGLMEETQASHGTPKAPYVRILFSF